MTTIAGKGVASTTNSGNSTSSLTKSVTQEYYVRLPKTNKRYHALKFNAVNFELTPSTKAEMVRDSTNTNMTRYEWENMPKTGQGSEFNREQRELSRRRKFGYVPKKIVPENMPWILNAKGTDKTKDKQYIGKKSITENSCYFVFVKCPDGGFEAHPLEDWYSFTAHKAYKTLNIEEAEEEFKRRHKILNKYLIMANKRKNEEGDDAEDDEDAADLEGLIGKTNKVVRLPKLDDLDSFGDNNDSRKKKKGNKKKSSNLSDDEEEESDDDDEGDLLAKKSSKLKKNRGKKTKKKAGGSDDDDNDELKNKEDSDDGDAEGLEKDYSSTSDEDSSGFDSDGERNGDKNEEDEEKYEEKGIDEEEPIKALDKLSDSESEESTESDDGLTEEGKEYRKLISKDGDSSKKKSNANNNDEDELDEFMRTGKTKIKDLNDDDSNSTFVDSDMEMENESGDKQQKKGKIGISNKLKRKATDELSQSKNGSLAKKASKHSASAPNLPITHDESSSSSTTSGSANKSAAASSSSKSSKTAAVIAAAAAAAAMQSGSTPSTAAASTSVSSASSASLTSSQIGLSEDEVRKYLTRKPMTTKELLQKVKSKTQNKLSRDELLESLRVILDKLKPKMIEKNGVKYLSL